jgi:rod shape determining protein RodA
MHLSVIRRRIRQRFRKFNKLTEKLFSRSYFKAIVILNFIALLNFYSVAGRRALISQSIIFLLGTAAAVVISNMKYEWIKRFAIPAYLSVCSLVFLVATIGTRVNGARRWLRIGVFTLQPTELLKLALILMIGFYLEARVKPNTRDGRPYNLLDLVIPLTLTALPLILVLKQPDLGTAIICLMITGSILFFMGIEKRTLVLITLVLFAGGFAGWKHLKPYQKDRVVHFLNPDMDYRGKNWQSHQSLIAFGSGGLLGKGTRRGPTTQLGYLPERETDFALASLAEEHGFITIGFVLLAINFIIMKILFIARNARDRFSAVVAIGVAFWIGCQAIINASMIMGLLPVVGVPFPIISYGGSSLLTILLAMGVMANIEQRRNII